MKIKVDYISGIPKGEFCEGRAFVCRFLPELAHRCILFNNVALQVNGNCAVKYKKCLNAKRSGDDTKLACLPGYKTIKGRIKTGDVYWVNHRQIWSFVTPKMVGKPSKDLQHPVARRTKP